jgi:polar amino acid transport system substrate-binding protein
MENAMPQLDRRHFVQSLAAVPFVLLAGGLGARANDDIIAKIKARGKLIAGTEATYPPFDFIKEGRVVGYGRDILENVTKSLGVELEYVDLPWAGVLPGLLAGKFDLVAAGVNVTPERAQKYAFTIPISEAAPAALKRKSDTSIKTVEDLSGKVVGTQLSSAGEQSSRTFEEKLKASGKQGYKELKTFVSYTECYLALMNGTVDAVVQNKASFGGLMKERPGLFEIVGNISDMRYIAWCTRPEEKALRDYVSKTIADLRDSGKLYELQDKWFGFRMPIPGVEYLPQGAI